MNTFGEVIGVTESNAKVKFIRTAACKNCGGCLTLSDNELVVELGNTLDAKVGDTVRIELHSKSVVKASLIMYGIPLLAMIVFAWIGSLFNDLCAAGFGIGATLIAYLILHAFEPRFERNNEFKPRMLEIVPDNE